MRSLHTPPLTALNRVEERRRVVCVLLLLCCCCCCCFDAKLAGCRRPRLSCLPVFTPPLTPQGPATLNLHASLRGRQRGLADATTLIHKPGCPLVCCWDFWLRGKRVGVLGTTSTVLLRCVLWLCAMAVCYGCVLWLCAATVLWLCAVAVRLCAFPLDVTRVIGVWHQILS